MRNTIFNILLKLTHVAVFLVFFSYGLENESAKLFFAIIGATCTFGFYVKAVDKDFSEV